MRVYWVSITCVEAFAKFLQTWTWVTSVLLGVFFTLFIGLLAITIGTLIHVFDPYDLIFRMKVTFSEGGETYEMWRKPPVDVYLKVYLFNVTNREAFLQGKEHLKVQEVGPYVYKESMEHLNPSFNPNGTITATPIHPLTWVPHLSNGTEEDILILPNIALLSFANVMSQASYFSKMAVNLLIKQTQSFPLVEQTAREFMFGYESTLVTLGNKFMPSWIVFDKLGLIDRMYDFKGDISTIYDGTTDVKKAGLIDTYNRLDHLPQWEHPCDKVQNASDGTKFPSLIKPDDSLYFFRKSMCRTMPMVRTSGKQMLNGLSGYEYQFKNGSMDNGHSYPENKCFCRNGKCLPSGLLDVTSCYYGFPIALSYPHFLDCDPKLREVVEGLHPSPKKHGTSFIINPESGTPLKVTVRMQINMALGDLSAMAHTPQFSNMVLPLLWTEIAMADLPTSLLARFILYLRIAPVAQTVLLYFLMLSGVAFIGLSMSAMIFIPGKGGNLMNNQMTEDGLNPSTWAEDRKKQRKKKAVQVARNRVEEQDRTQVENNNINIKSEESGEEEMETYYCSLLSPTDRQADLDADLLDRLKTLSDTET
ncbi:unnamed protein product [Bemisia tabaci]|uniref:Scavenger receptor class B member 1-like n=1 Tax=Bemisia tabaci TaxID=7038 RepID=A0A9P0F1J8_BEMTA|nr:PREDICTED: scavenger receptor class B member 1-like isoform X2 [Bemisia tabaci]CAH0385788.1 unnamed protein product [Bemisia tabaci]